MISMSPRICWGFLMSHRSSQRSRRSSGRGPGRSSRARLQLSERQQQVLRALVAAYVGEASPVGSRTVSHLLPIKLSSASIRNTMAQLAELGLIEKPHASAGRVPTERGLRFFVDELLDPTDLALYQRCALDRSFEGVEAEGVVHRASQLLSDHTRQLGFVVAPRLERVVLRHIALVRLSSERLLVVLVSRDGHAHRRVIGDRESGGQRELDQVASELNRRASGRTLGEVREALRREVIELRSEAERTLGRTLRLGLRALEERVCDSADLVVATRLALFEQPEFSDPERLREILATVETNERLLEILGDVLEREGVSVVLGEDLSDPGLSRCALVAASYGGDLGALGVIGPSRMDYARIIPLVSYCSRLVTQKLIQ